MRSGKWPCTLCGWFVAGIYQWCLSARVQQACEVYLRHACSGSTVRLGQSGLRSTGLCVCVSVCSCVCVCGCVCVYTCVCVSVVCVCIRECMWVCVSMCRPIYLCGSLYVWEPLCARGVCVWHPCGQWQKILLWLHTDLLFKFCCTYHKTRNAW